jgi:hypothetical protein
LIVKLPVAELPDGSETTMSGGCHIPAVCGWPFMALQVAPAVAALVPVPHAQPHIGATLPSGSVAVWRVAVRYTVCAGEMVADHATIVRKSRTAFAID